MNELPMTTPSTPPPSPESGDIAAELRELGRNLAEALRSAWESEERKRIQMEIETGLVEIGTTLNQAAKDFSDSPTGQTIKSDLKGIQERIQNGEVETKLRADLLSALRTANAELKKATHSNPPPPPEA